MKSSHSRLVCALILASVMPFGQSISAFGPDRPDLLDPQADQQAANEQTASPAGPQTSGPAAAADAVTAAAAAAAGLPEIDGPPAPMPPEMIRRDEKGDATIRATRISRPLDIDGRLNDEVYQLTPAIGGFIQQVPREGQPATEPTEVWIFFDDDTLYVAGHCIETEPERAVANELRRDHNNIFQTDNITVVFDTFYDRRNGFFFQTNQLSAIRDQAISENQQLVAWNTVWAVRSARVEDGWTFEMAIPFKSLRYRQPGPQVWGINFRRVVKWKNETSLLTALPASYGTAGVSQMGSAGTLVGLETPGLSKNLEFKPYVVAASTTDETARNPFRNRFGRDVGVDVKYGLTSSLVADLTVNTDFAQVEEDVQQVNLTRFNLQFPEKRDFFLEGQGIFAFGDRARVSAGSDVPIVFFSRRIGLAAGQAVPVQIGGRVTGKAGAWDIGLLNIQTDEKDVDDVVIANPTNFSVVRIKRDIFRRSSIGIIATHRAETSGGGANNSAGGADATFRLSDSTTVTGYYAQTRSPGDGGDGASYRGRFDYAADRYGLAFEHLLVDGEFNPEVGFVRRRDFRRSFGQARFSPRTAASNRVIRRFSYQGSVDYVTNADASIVENRTLTGNFDIEFHSSDALAIDYTREYEFLADNFPISTGVLVPAGEYTSDSVRTAYTLGQQRKLSGSAAASWSTFYNGTRFETTYSGRVGFMPQFAIEPSITLNWVDLPYGDFTAQLITNRFIVTPTPRLSVTGLVQVNASADTVSSSVRLRWEYIPGSELFVVYSDGRDTTPTTPIGLLNRSIAIKATRLLRF
jgi:hypothetical protein